MSRAPTLDGEPDRGRRRILVGGSAAAAGVWVAPSVLTLDRVAAATGTCGAPPVQVDWSDYANNGTAPGSVTADDGTVVTLSSSDPFNVAGSRHFTVRTELYGGTTGFLASEMVNGNNGEYVEIQFAFSRPVQLCFTLLDIDRDRSDWEDTVRVRGTLSGVAVPITTADAVTGPAVAQIATDTFRGVLNTNTDGSSAAANVTVNYPSPIDTLVIRHSDRTSWTAGQIIGIHDLLWC